MNTREEKKYQVTVVENGIETLYEVFAKSKEEASKIYMNFDPFTEYDGDDVHLDDGVYVYEVVDR